MWVYWVAPAAGSTIAALIYTVLFLTRSFPVVEAVAPTTVKYTSYTPIVPTETSRLVGTPTV